LPAILYNSSDYVQAQRERRVMLAEMAPVYAKYDVLLAPTASGPAPRLDTWRTIRFWQHASLMTPFNVTGGPDESRDRTSGVVRCIHERLAIAATTTPPMPYRLLKIGRARW